MGGEEDNTGVNTNPDGVEAETKVLTSTGEPLQRQRWQMHVRQVMSCLAATNSMVLESISSEDDDSNDEGDGGGERVEDTDAVRPASVSNVHDGVCWSS